MRPVVLLPVIFLLATGPQVSQAQRQRRGVCEPPEVTPAGFAFYFTRAVYSDFAGWGRPSWATDCPEADQHFVFGLKRLTNIDAFDLQHMVSLEDSALRNYPFLYAVEVGRMALTDTEVEGLRTYLLAGGFLVVDDFWGTREWATFAGEMERVLPEYPIVELPMDHPLLDTFYQIDTVLQVPNVRQGRWGGPTWEKDGYIPHLRGILDSEGRLLVLISWNSDLGDAWEWADDPYYPILYSNYAYRLGVNLVLYGMTH